MKPRIKVTSPRKASTTSRLYPTINLDNVNNKLRDSIFKTAEEAEPEETVREEETVQEEEKPRSLLHSPTLWAALAAGVGITAGGVYLGRNRTPQSGGAPSQSASPPADPAPTPTTDPAPTPTTDPMPTASAAASATTPAAASTTTGPENTSAPDKPATASIPRAAMVAANAYTVSYLQTPEGRGKPFDDTYSVFLSQIGEASKQFTDAPALLRELEGATGNPWFGSYASMAEQLQDANTRETLSRSMLYQGAPIGTEMALLAADIALTPVNPVSRLGQAANLPIQMLGSDRTIPVGVKDKAVQAVQVSKFRNSTDQIFNAILDSYDLIYARPTSDYTAHVLRSGPQHAVFALSSSLNTVYEAARTNKDLVASYAAASTSGSDQQTVRAAGYHYADMLQASLVASPYALPMLRGVAAITGATLEGKNPLPDTTKAVLQGAALTAAAKIPIGRAAASAVAQRVAPLAFSAAGAASKAPSFINAVRLASSPARLGAGALFSAGAGNAVDLVNMLFVPGYLDNTIRDMDRATYNRYYSLYSNPSFFNRHIRDQVAPIGSALLGDFNPMRAAMAEDVGRVTGTDASKNLRQLAWDTVQSEKAANEVLAKPFDFQELSDFQQEAKAALDRYSAATP